MLIEVPTVSSGGREGSIHVRTLTSNVPTSGSSFFWPSPGVIAFCQASIAAFSSAPDFFDLSCAAAGEAAAATSAAARARRESIFILRPP